VRRLPRVEADGLGAVSGKQSIDSDLKQPAVSPEASLSASEPGELFVKIAGIPDQIREKGSRMLFEHWLAEICQPGVRVIEALDVGVVDDSEVAS
jgi:hypothetical protein